MIKYISLGTDCKEYFNYDGKPLPIRPLSTYELDEILKKAVEGLSSIVFEKVVKLKLNVLDKKEEIKLDKNKYKDFLTYYNEVDYWTVYYAMKDFQSEKFSMPDYEGEFKDDFEDWVGNKPKGYYIVRKMKYVHKISDDIMNMTSPRMEELVSIIENDQGKILATIVHKLNTPLVSKAWELTPFQTKFLYYTRDGAPEIVESIDDVPGIKKGNFNEITKQLKEMGF